MGAPLFVRGFFAHIRTVTGEGEKEVTRIVRVLQGNPVPENVPDDELDRLKGLGMIGRKPGVTSPADHPVTGVPGVPAGGLDLGNLAAMTDDELSVGVHKVGVAKLVAAVGDDKALAARLLAAEMTATKDDPRASLVEALEKITGGVA